MQPSEELLPAEIRGILIMKDFGGVNMTKWKCECACGFVVEADKAPVCCGKKMERVEDDAKATGCCCCTC
jgi:hypothetical protein